MQRFGRSAQKMKDRWGGSFILATVLALVGAWYAGDWLNAKLNEGQPVTIDPGTNIGSNHDPANVSAPIAKDFSAYFVQVGAFKTPESAQKEVANFAKKGYQAAVVNPEGSSFHKVWVGPFTTAQARDDAHAKLKKVMKQTPGKVTWNINQGLAVAASTGSNNAKLQEGIAALNSYLQEAAVWWENQTAGNPAPTDTLLARSEAVKKSAKDLQKQSKDGAVAKFLELAQQVDANAKEIAAAANGQAVSAESGKALQNYVSLLNEYKDWTSGAAAANSTGQ